MRTTLVVAASLLLGSAPAAPAQAPALQRIDKEPLLRIEANGPTAHVNALAFGPGGDTLFSAGYDKLIRTAALAGNGKRFEPGAAAYRVPIGPGNDGTVNAVAVSPDGKWLAAAGYGLVPGKAGFRDPGRVVPKVGGMSPEMRRAEGTVHVFDTTTGDVRRLEGHLGPVLALTFLPARAKKPAVLVSLALEFQGKDKDGAGAVRIWDVAGGKEVHLLTGLPVGKDQEVGPVGLAAWHTGNAASQARVAVAWNDGTLRVWDPDQTEPGRPWELLDGRSNTSVAYVPDSNDPDRGRLFTGSFQGGGRLQAWSSVPGRKPEPLGKPGAALAEGKNAFPRTLALFPSRPGGQPDHAAVITATARDKDLNNYKLHLIDLADPSLSARATIHLWESRGYRTSVAADPTGRFLAAAGNQQHRVPIYAVAELLAKGANARPLGPDFRSDGATVNYVAFKKNKDGGLGLVLSEARGKLPNTPPPELDRVGMVFDFTSSALTAYRPAEWRDAGASLGKWDAKPVKSDDPAAPLTVVVSDGGKRVGGVPLQRTWERVYFALLPPRLPPPADVPLLAVAYDEGGEAVLALYNARTGEAVRVLTGHVNPIRALAFSEDGKLLATAAEDQTVCVWTLTDLDNVLSRQGQLRGLPVIPGGQKDTVALAKPDDSSLADENKKELKSRGIGEADVVEKVAVGGNEIEVKSPRDFYNAVWRARPGTRVTLHVRNKKPASLLVGQGTDEQKPLVSLFVTRADKVEARKWVGWNPTGPYDFSDRDAERLLGWHTNTGEADRPVRYALAHEYRKQHHKPEILRLLVEQKNTGLAVEAWKALYKKRIEPGLTLEVSPPAPADAAGRSVARRRPQALVLTVNARHPDTRVGAVRWQPEGGDWAGLERTGEREWTADLSKRDWKRGPYRLRVEVETEAPEREKYTRELTLVYQPAPPTVREAAPHPLVVKDDLKYRLKADVLPGGDEPVEVRLSLNGAPVPGKKWTAREPLKIDEVLELKADRPGANRIELVAFNQGHEAEKDALNLEVAYKTTAPEILLSAVALPGGRDVRIGEGPVVVTASPVRVVGRVEALTELVKPRWALDGGAEEVLPLKAGQTKLDFSQPVRLKPGQRHKVRFLAETRGGGKAEQSVVVEYRPQPPELVLLAPADGQVVHEGKVTLKGSLLWPADRVSCQAFPVGDKAAEEGKPRDVGVKQEELELEVPLWPGDNWVQVKLKNAWHESLSPRVLVRYLRPPRLVGPLAHAAAKDGKSYVEVQAQAESAAALPLTRVELNGRELGAGAFRLEPGTKKGDVTAWKVAVPGVPVQRGANQVALRVGNADGWSTSTSGEILIKQEQLPKAHVAFLDPPRDVTVEDPEYAVRLGVRSPSPLQKVELRRGREVLASWAGPDLKGKDDYRELQTKVALQAGANVLTVAAQNDGGEQVSLPLVVTYNFQPFRIVLEGVELPNNQVLVPQPGLSADGWQTFGQAPGSRVWVRGRVVSARKDEQWERLDVLRLYVNDRQQRPLRLRAADGKPLEKTFREEVQLDKETNEVEVKLPAELKHEAASRRRCRVGCQKFAPRPRRQPHLVVFDTERTDKDKLLGQLYTALNAKETGEGRFRIDGYEEEGVLHGPLVGPMARPERLNHVLRELKLSLRAEAQRGSADDVVYLYFRSGEALFPGGHVFQAGDRPADPEARSGIDCEALEDFFGESLGRGVLFLDVARLPFEQTSPSARAQSRDRVLQWPDDPHVVVMRYVWWGQPAKQKPEARLSTALAQEMPRAKQLRDVKALFEKRFADEPPRPALDFKQLTLFLRVPAVWLDFPVGR